METSCAYCSKNFEKDEGKLNADGDFVCFVCLRNDDQKEDEKGVCESCGEYSDECRDDGACPFCGESKEPEDGEKEKDEEEEEEK